MQLGKDPAARARRLEARLREPAIEQAAAAAAIAADPEPARVLEALASSRDGEIRVWVPTLAAAVLGRAAIPLLESLLDHGDPEVRGTALDALEALDPQAMARLIPRLRRNVRSTRPAEVISSAWRLAALGDRASVEDIRAFRDGYAPDVYLHKAADAILDVLTDPERVLRRIRGHDHARMPWLAYAAIVIGTPEALAVLREAATGAPDETCRAACAYRLAEAGQPVDPS